MADTSLIFRIIASEHVSGALDKIKRNAEATGAAVAKALAGPALLPALATGAVGAASFGVAIASAGAAFGVFGKVATKAMSDVKEEVTKITQLQDKIEELNQQSKMAKNAEDAAKFTKQAAAAQQKLNAQMALMPAPMRQAVQQQMAMTEQWDKFVDKNKPATFATMQAGYKLITSSVSKMQPLFDIGKRAVDRLIASLQGAVDGGFIERLSARAGPAMNSLITIIQNTARALGGMLGKVGGAQGQGMLTWLEGITAKWATWSTATNADSGFNRFLAYAQQNGPAVLTTLTSLAQAAVHIAQAVSPLAPVSLAIATALAQLIAVVPPDVLTALVAGYLALNVALKAQALYAKLAAAATAVWGKRAALAGVQAKASAAGAKALAAAQWVLNAALTGVKWVWASAQLVAYKVKQAALAAASKVAAAAQWLFNAALVGAGWVAATAAMAGYAIKQGIIMAATKAWTAAQWLLNVAMSMNPIGWVIIAVVALVAVIVVLWNKSATFRNFWITVWNGIKVATLAVWNAVRTKVSEFWAWITNVVSNIRTKTVAGWNAVKTGAVRAWDSITSKVSKFYNWVTGLPGKISGRLFGMWDGVKTGLKAALNWVIGRLRGFSFSIGGGSFMGIDIPQYTIGFGNLPYLDRGAGMVQQSGLAVIHRGESVTPAARVTPYRSGSGGGGATITINGSNAKVIRVLLELLRDGIRDQGGDPVKVLTPR